MSAPLETVVIQTGPHEETEETEPFGQGAQGCWTG